MLRGSAKHTGFWISLVHNKRLDVASLILNCLLWDKCYLHGLEKKKKRSFSHHWAFNCQNLSMVVQLLLSAIPPILALTRSNHQDPTPHAPRPLVNIWGTAKVHFPSLITLVAGELQTSNYKLQKAATSPSGFVGGRGRVHTYIWRSEDNFRWTFLKGCTLYPETGLLTDLEPTN